MGREISTRQLSRIKEEDDFAQIEIDDQVLKIERTENISLSDNTASFVGTLSSDDPDNPTRTSRYHDDYALTDLTSGNFVTIDLVSPDFDTYLQLIDADTGELIDSNDDGGTGVNSKLSFAVDASKSYVVRVTSFGSGRIGSYQLDLEVSSLADFPNLAVSDTNIPESIVVGESVEIDWSVINQENSDLDNQDWFDTVYLSKDPIGT